MAELSIFWTNTALKQRNYTFEYWNDRNKSTTYSKKLNSSIKERTTILKTNPELGKKTEFNDTRVISLGHYSILYRKVNSKIIITGFWDNRQNPDKLLKFLSQE
ncbi:type II toxin-antitoxin system RelE/ParE family toxin [Lutibacter sp.]|uniref:type II toxin-antitoxin system RelE/ParE family toxin n=1 Tax=Lutibacter sp. TaxID=1925666 RepID=UPI0027357D2D|nr:type II toxin-antitoxin system RelE/ParE family toxin [Lutibacter sp.]MDP3311721.1 type II toxin-antitoxin system RelE/ParE family toxin [Lutibacter sp.]